MAQQISSDCGPRFEQLRMLEMAFQFLNNEGITGDYAEFGVFRGAAFAEAYDAARRWGNAPMRFHAFDSFAGLPPLDPNDATGPFREGQFSCATRQYFEQALRKERVRHVAGDDHGRTLISVCTGRGASRLISGIPDRLDRL